MEDLLNTDPHGHVGYGSESRRQKLPKICQNLKNLKFYLNLGCIFFITNTMKGRQKPRKKILGFDVPVLFNFKFFLSGRFFTLYIRIRMKAEADPLQVYSVCGSTSLS